MEPLVKPPQYRHRNISSGKLKGKKKTRYMCEFGVQRVEVITHPLFIFFRVLKHKHNHEPQRKASTLFIRFHSKARQGKGDQEACHVDGLGLGISRKRGSSHYLRTLYANQGSPSTITANGEGRKKVRSGSPPSVTSSSSRAASSSKSWSYQAVGRALLIEVVKAS